MMKEGNEKPRPDPVSVAEVQDVLPKVRAKFPGVVLAEMLIRSAADYVLYTTWKHKKAGFDKTIEQSLGNTSKWTKKEKQAHCRAVSLILTNRSIVATAARKATEVEAARANAA